MQPIVTIPPDPKYCSRCGFALEPRDEDEGIRCQSCHAIFWPPGSQAVVTVLQPVETEDGKTGLLYVQRLARDGSVRPPNEGWCLPGGFTRFGMTLEEDAKNECVGESGAVPDISRAVVVDAETATEGHALIALLCPPIRERDLPPFPENRETSARRIGFDANLTFSIHARWATEFFAGRFDNWPARLQPTE